MRKIKFLSAVIFISLIAACNSDAQNKTQEKNGIKLTPVTDSPLFPDASLKLVSPAPNAPLTFAGDSVKVTFNYELENFKLTDQTTDAKDKHCSNSKQGQHIHVIVNNAPYLAKYETNFSVPFVEGNYVVLSFLSRSYHESLKHKKAYDLRQFSVGAGSRPVDLTTPLLFYSRPKGEYVGEDTKKVLLDFYLINCELSAKGYKVRATINGTVFIITKWEALAMEGLPMGENTIQLELLDKNDKTVVSAFNSVSRKITLKP